jgi:uncharacterized surface protein with fasciclin (FAS1) repeats
MAAMRPSTIAIGCVALVSLAGCQLTRDPDPVVEATAPPSPHVVRDLVGPGCDTYVREHASGPGSPAAIAKQPVATAIASLPQLTEFAKAISGGLNSRVDLTARLNAGKFTILAPTDAAFAKLPTAAMRALSGPDSASALTDLLRSHVLEGELAPDALTSDLKALDGSTVVVAASRDRIRIGGQANVVCGGLRTSNATIYLIDGVLMPPPSSSTSADSSASPTPATKE